MALNINYDYYIDLQSFEVKKPSEVDAEFKTIVSLNTTDNYKGVKGKRGRAEQDAIKKHISHLKYVLKHTIETDDEYGEFISTLSSLRAKLPTITPTKYPEWFL